MGFKLVIPIVIVKASSHLSEVLHNGILVVGSKGVVAGDANNRGGVGEVVPGEEEEGEDRNDLLLRSHHN